MRRSAGSPGTCLPAARHLAAELDAACLRARARVARLQEGLGLVPDIGILTGQRGLARVPVCIPTRVTMKRNHGYKLYREIRRKLLA